MPLDQLYKEIGWEAVSIAGDDRGGKVLVYAEVQDGVASTDVFFVNRKGEVQVALSPDPLVGLVYALWNRWKEKPGNEEWRVMTYLVDENDQMHIHLTYPEDVDDNPLVGPRRSKAVEKHFGKAKVNYPHMRKLD